MNLNNVLSIHKYVQEETLQISISISLIINKNSLINTMMMDLIQL